MVIDMATTAGQRNFCVDTTPSISDQLGKAKEDFPAPKLDQVKNFTYDLGAAYAFPKNRVITDLPAGIYYPSYNRNQDFLLSKASVSQQSDSMNSENMFDHLEMILGESNNDPETHYKIQQVIQKRRHEYLGDGYFPMHHFHEGLEDVHGGIIKFLNSKSFYTKSNLGFKRSVLLYGPTGSGKSRYMDFISNSLIHELHAIVI